MILNLKSFKTRLPLVFGVVLALALAAALACSGPSETPEPAQPTSTAAPAEPTSTAAPAEPTKKPVEAEPTKKAVEAEPGTEADGEPISVVATTNFLADWASNVGGEHVEVTGLLPVGGNPHAYQPGAKDVARVADADLVLSVGLGLEGGWLAELIRNAARDPSLVVELAEFVDPIEFGDSHEEDAHLIEEVSHVIHEVEDGEISPLEGLAEIRSLIEGVEDDHGHMDEGDDHGHEDEGDDHGHEDEGDDHGHEDEGDDHGHEDEGDDHGHEDEGDDHGHMDEGDDHGHMDEGDDHGHMDEGDDHGHEDEHHGEGLADRMLDVVNDAEAGLISAEDAIESLEAMVAMAAMEEEGEDEHAHAGHGHGTLDPHFWFDPLRVKIAVGVIADLLSELDPDRAGVYAANADAYSVQLDELHAWTGERLEVVPSDRRLLLTSHDSLGYFAALYDFEVVGVILGFTTEIEPSAEEIARLIDKIRLYEVPAVFGETTVSDRMARSLADETGVSFVTLYSGSLGGPDSDASTYLDMVRANATRIAEALK